MKTRIQYYAEGKFGETLFSSYETSVNTPEEVSRIITKAFQVNGVIFFETHPGEDLNQTVLLKRCDGLVDVYRAGKWANQGETETLTRRTAVNRIRRALK